MKYILFIIDGAADYPIEELNNKTPLQVAKKPNIDSLAKKGKCGLLETVPKEMPPDSAVANMSILGYDLKKCYQGRGVLEAANIGVKIEKDDVVFRCNIICEENGKIKNHSGGHISTEEAHKLIEALDEKLGNNEIRFYPGVSYRNLLVLKGKKYSADVECTPPHDVPGTEISKVLVRANNEKGKETANLLNKLILDSKAILEKHPVNIKKVKEGKDPANMIWPWSPGKKPAMKTFQELYKIKGAAISAVDLINGLGVYAGFDVIKVEGATGLWNTNYEGKADACINALKNHDLVYVHVEAADEASHEGDLKLKIKCIEDFDKRLLGRVLANLKEEVSVAILPDHLTPVKVKTHVHGAVPFLIYRPNGEEDNVKEFSELSCKKGSYGLLKNDEFIKSFLKR